MLLLLRNWVAHTKTLWFYHFLMCEKLHFQLQQASSRARTVYFCEQKLNLTGAWLTMVIKAVLFPKSKHQRVHISSSFSEGRNSWLLSSPAMKLRFRATLSDAQSIWQIYCNRNVQQSAPRWKTERTDGITVLVQIFTTCAPCRHRTCTSVKKSFIVSCKFSLMHMTWGLAEHMKSIRKGRATTFVSSPTADDQMITLMVLGKGIFPFDCSSTSHRRAWSCLGLKFSPRAS